MFYIFTFVISYLVAAINPAIVISKRLLKQDIRNLGSGNAGTTNAIRTMGKGIGALVFILDLLKVVVSYGLICLIGFIFKEQISASIKSLYMLASVLGHSYPVYYGLKGGKGVAVFLMSAIIVDAKMALICIVIGVVVIAVSRMVSLGSMTGSAMLVILDLFMDTNYNFILMILTVTVVIYNHRENIARILAGKENKLF
ncbi:MAG: glycerol-3-phosphate 1-O-acyltransferase PlsY [Clostridia bacterium]|nr:glycerol-3-phosphate 1-O-acyltransferase PlsY [Clostridia bacterium]